MDPWKILGIEKGASREVVQKAYRAKVRKHHPDMGGDDWAFHQVQEAYEALVNPDSVQKKAPATKRPASPSPSKNSSPKNDPPEAENRANSTGSGSAQSTNSNSGNRRPNGQTPKQPPRQAPRKKFREPPATKTTYRQAFGNPRPLRDKGTDTDAPFSWKQWKNFFFGKLPLQSETTYFILVNVLDIIMTQRLLQFGNAREANPIAAYVIEQWGFVGAIVLKLGIVAFVCVIAQIVAMKKLRTAQALLVGGTVIVGGVVVYSIWLYLKHFA
ncbi:MAG: DUF5658 family protein [Mariniblastus sp.]